MAGTGAGEPVAVLRASLGWFPKSLCSHAARRCSHLLLAAPRLHPCPCPAPGLIPGHHQGVGAAAPEASPLPLLLGGPQPQVQAGGRSGGAGSTGFAQHPKGDRRARPLRPRGPVPGRLPSLASCMCGPSCASSGWGSRSLDTPCPGRPVQGARGAGPVRLGSRRALWRRETASPPLSLVRPCVYACVSVCMCM